MKLEVKDLKEPLLTLSEACRLLPKRPSPASLWRWRVRGVNGACLACVRIGARWYTTRSAMAEFIAQQTAFAAPQQQSPPAEVGSRSEAVERRLRAAGCLGTEVAAKASKHR